MYVTERRLNVMDPSDWLAVVAAAMARDRRARRAFSQVDATHHIEDEDSELVHDGNIGVAVLLLDRLGNSSATSRASQFGLDI